ncbi:MAG: DNA repair protein RecN, partial [Gammaproteobacteria bacterium]|nr:DNA repair protein RecN [Gammaproteobacteria bacterium]
TVASLEAERDAAAAAYQEHAAALSKARGKSARRMGKAITELMHTLGMPNGTFEVAVSAEERERPSAGGADNIEFLVSANPGQPPRPLARIASGGELSRISLAIQVATAGHTGVPVLVYDEVDAGIGGGVAEIVGQRLAELATTRQLLCITHLPQIACFGTTHFVVGKRQQSGSTSTWIETLDGDERTIEIARMLGGLDITDTTIDHAREMLEKSCRS